jgi:hypothetical protein
MNFGIAHRYRRTRWLTAVGCVLTAVALLLTVVVADASAAHRSSHPRLVLRRSSNAPTHQTLSQTSFGELDCNGYSPEQQAVRLTMPCTDVRGNNAVDNANTWDGRFYDNGKYIGHDEPLVTFLSSTAGSGNNVSWTETLGKDPFQAPAVSTPGSDVSHWFELSSAPWVSMAMCDPNSYPQLPCSAQSDLNAPACITTSSCPQNSYPGGGSAFMEMQLYPPGQPPWVDNISCDNGHWCAALTIDSLECTLNFVQCNNNCPEPINFAFVQTNGVPAGPPSPQDANLDSATPNGRTLLMNPGDTIRIHMFDAAVPGQPGQKAFEVMLDDLTTHQSGFMQASAANGFMNTSIVDCSGTPFNFQPEYNTAARKNIVPWAADQVDIGTQFETGHWEACTRLLKPFTFSTASVGFPGATDNAWNECLGPYESSGAPDDTSPEAGDALCYPAGDTHGSLNSPPDTTTGCLVNFIQNGDLDFDGSPYWTEWPTSTTPGIYPSSFVESLPTTGGSQYPQFFLQTDVGLSEASCPGNTVGGSGTGGCAVPPPAAPGQFYPYWTRVTKSTATGTACTFEFGNVSKVPGATANTYGKDAQYGTVQTATYGYPQFIGPTRSNACG